MAKFLYRVCLISVESTSAKSRKKDLGELTKLETENKREAQAEIERLQAMIDRDSWQVACEIVAERAEICDYQRVNIDTLEPTTDNGSGGNVKEQIQDSVDSFNNS